MKDIKRYIEEYGEILLAEEGDICMFADHAAIVAALQEQVQKLAAESSELIELYRQAVSELDDTCFENGMMRGEKSMEYPAPETPATNAVIREIGAKAVEEHWNKPGFSFDYGAAYAHFGNGDVMVGTTKLTNGKSGIAFAPVEEKSGGIGTEYEWTRGKNTQEVGSLFIIESSSIEGLEVIIDKLQEAIEELRAGDVS